MNLDEIIIATGNEGKAREFGCLMGGVFNKVFSLKDFPSVVMPEETGETFAENSLLKAQTVFETVRSEHSVPPAVLADDSGIEISALGGMPGVRSARYAGENSTDEENLDKLMSELKGVKDRGARYVCVLTLILPDGEKIIVNGVCEGVIAETKKGGGGFGYDPVFFLPFLGKTMAEISAEEKNRISHRGKASREIALRVREISQ
ncbi:RdgB/HAM1 family non-canonical purine NTP pyrophosphatase [Candidatus Mycalebacterium sp.]